jgi:hypothetical protein
MAWHLLTRSSTVDYIDLQLNEDLPIFASDGVSSQHEPYVNRWQRRFADTSGYIFFKHIRKAGGTAVRNYIHEAMKHHGHGTLHQLVERYTQQEVTRHFPFLLQAQKNLIQNYYNNTNNTTNATSSKNAVPKVYYIEQEWSSMDWKCRANDPRWNNNTLSIITLRHPIERHLSEYFYSGAPARGKFMGHQFGSPQVHNNQTFFRIDKSNTLQINRTQIYVNRTYTHLLSIFLQDNLVRWLDESNESNSTNMKWYFGQYYTDNLQLRALAGCAASSSEGDNNNNDDDKCLNTRLIGVGTNKARMIRKKINENHPNNANSTTTTTTTTPIITGGIINSVCTMQPFYRAGKGGDSCNKSPEVCPHGCDGPCFYPAIARGPLTSTDLSRAKFALEGFDIILLTETLDDIDQMAFLADVLGIPRNVTIPSGKLRANINTKKDSMREKTHYYRDLMYNLTFNRRLVQRLLDENALEIELYEYAVELNRRMVESWKREVGAG